MDPERCWPRSSPGCSGDRTRRRPPVVRVRRRHLRRGRGLADPAGHAASRCGAPRDARIAGRGIVSVPNFGLWRHRAHLLLRGRMPMSAELPYPWWSTPNIHLSTLADLEALFASLDLTVRSRVMLDASGSASVGMRAKGPANLMASGAVYLVESR
ncbi:MAG: methionine biosynthesis protein MetW [Microthrixaceae bacterium]